MSNFWEGHNALWKWLYEGLGSFVAGIEVVILMAIAIVLLVAFIGWLDNKIRR